MKAENHVCPTLLRNNILLTWDVSYAIAVAHLAPPGRHIQLKECCGHEQQAKKEPHFKTNTT